MPPRGAKKLAELRVSMVAKASAISAYSCAKERVKEEKARQSCPVSQQVSSGKNLAAVFYRCLWSDRQEKGHKMLTNNF